MQWRASPLSLISCVMVLFGTSDLASAASRPDGAGATGLASWYGNELRGRPTASGEPFDPEAMSAAHRTLPLSAYVEVTSLDTGKTVIVRINDRGPYHGNRIIDLSFAAARRLGITGSGARLVHIRRVDRKSAMQAQPRAATVMRRDNLDRLRALSSWTAPVDRPSAIPAGGGPYFIRVATFSSKRRADAMAENLGATLFTANGLYQVRLGPFSDANKVKAALAPLAAKGYPDSRVVR